MPQIATQIERSLLPRGLLGRPDFKFSIGAAVLFHGELATIRDRARTAAGREMYDIELAAHDDRPLRTVLERALEALPAVVSLGSAAREYVA